MGQHVHKENISGEMPVREKKKKHGGRWETDSQQARERHRETRKVE